MCGCGVPFSIEHALDFRFGAWSLVGIMGFRMLLVTLLSLVWTPVVKKPVVHDESAGADTLITDLCVCGVWEPQIKALFDIRIVDTDA